MSKLSVLVVGCGGMGASHARAYHKMDAFEIVGLVSKTAKRRTPLNQEFGGGIPEYDDFDKALAECRPDAVSINTYPDTHAEFAIKAMRSGAHVFVEKPLAQSVAKAEEVMAVAIETQRKVVVGYILRHHPSWKKFVEIAQTLGKPLVLRMNLNQQSSGENWEGHKNLLKSLSPIADCGVHYVDMMCLMTGAKPKSVSAIGARLTDEIDSEMYNYGQLQVRFDDGSVGWYEAGWGPMISEEAFFVKDVIGPKGCVNMVKRNGNNKYKYKNGDSADIESHTQTNCIRVHSSQLDDNGQFKKKDEFYDMAGEPGHQELCDLEQKYFLQAIKDDLDLTKHMLDAVNSLKIVLAADESVKTGKIIEL